MLRPSRPAWPVLAVLLAAGRSGTSPGLDGRREGLRRADPSKTVSFSPGVPERSRAQGFESHGLIIRRGDRVVFKEADHRVRIEDVRAALRRELGLASPPS